MTGPSKWGQQPPATQSCSTQPSSDSSSPGETLKPKYRHASIDIFVGEPWRGQRIGADAVRTLATYLVRDLGHHRVVIDPLADNAAAIQCYRKVGFKPVGVMRRYELTKRPASGKTASSWTCSPKNSTPLSTPLRAEHNLAGVIVADMSAKQTPRSTPQFL